MKKEKQNVQSDTQPAPETAENQINEQPAVDNAENENAEQAESESEAEAEPTPEESLKCLAAAYAELEKTNQQITAARQELDNQLVRLQADFDNFRRRTRLEKEDWQRNTIAAFCGDLLPVIDNFGRALQALKASEAENGQASGHLAGVEMIARQLAELLAAKGVERIPAVGEDFDPNWHEAIGQTPVEDDALVGKVTEEIQAGYRIGDKVLRASMVHVGAK